jgi:hypothetical protein
MVFSQFVQQVVDTCFRARPNSLDDANVDPPPSILSVHSASRREGATPFRRVIQQDLGTRQRHTISRRCRSVSAAIQTLVWSDREFVNRLPATARTLKRFGFDGSTWRLEGAARSRMSLREALVSGRWAFWYGGTFAASSHQSR